MTELTAVTPQESEPPKRKRGRQKGIAKPPGSGRRKAQPGLSGRAAREYLSKHSNVLEIYCRISRGQPIKLAGPTGKVVWHYPSWDDVRWVCERVDRKLIPDLTAMALTGEDGQPIQSQQHMILEASQRVLAAFPTGSSTDDTATAIGPDALEGVKALNFIQASQEAAERDQAPDRTSARPP
jgi:hypothetical protein